MRENPSDPKWGLPAPRSPGGPREWSSSLSAGVAWRRVLLNSSCAGGQALGRLQLRKEARVPILRECAHSLKGCTMTSMPSPSLASPAVASTSLACALIAFATLALTAPAQAQRSSAPPSPPPAASQPSPQPPLGFDAWGRGPPPPPERPYVAPMPQVAPPMQRVPPVAPLSPRLGN
jgi:hypothetical protein